MTLDKLIDNCQALEKTISVLIKGNSNKQLELNRLQNQVFDESQASLDSILKKENDMQQKLDSLKLKKNDLDIEIKQYCDINGKLSDLVAIVQQSDNSHDGEANCKNEEMGHIITESLEEYNQLKQECAKVVSKMSRLTGGLDEYKQQIRDFIVDKQNVVVELHRNDASIRLLEQQNNFVEQQFDLIINQLPWEPLTDQYIDGLRKSSMQSIKDVAETLQLQKNEIEELTESLNIKKTKKLEVLEQLYSELNSFIQKRDEAVLITRVLDG